jgi:hypothetical protein
MVRNLPTALAQADQLLGSNSHLDLICKPHQDEADFQSVFNLCSGGDGSLEKDFWLFIIVLFYMEVLKRKNYFSQQEDGGKEAEDKLSKLLFKIIKVRKKTLDKKVFIQIPFFYTGDKCEIFTV